MNSPSKRDSYKRLGDIVLSDFDIRQRRFQTLPNFNLDEACSTILSLGRERPIVYTAFDGDHFQLCGHMRSWSEYPIPKVRVGPRWPLTRKEGGLK